MKYCPDCNGEVAVPIEDCPREKEGNVNKPPVLKDINKIWPDEVRLTPPVSWMKAMEEIERCARLVAQAQRDADMEWYKDNIGLVAMETLPVLIEVERVQARQETAREIFEEIETNLLISTAMRPNPPMPNYFIRETELKKLKEEYGITETTGNH